MTKREEILDAINHLEANIKAGERFAEQGYDTGGMLYFTRSMLREYYTELAELDKKDRSLAGAFY